MSPVRIAWEHWGRVDRPIFGLGGGPIGGLQGVPDQLPTQPELYVAPQNHISLKCPADLIHVKHPRQASAQRLCSRCAVIALGPKSRVDTSA
jgi:hypothetical protein